jgi:hypothetical protein
MILMDLFEPEIAAVDASLVAPSKGKMAESAVMESMLGFFLWEGKWLRSKTPMFCRHPEEGFAVFSERFSSSEDLYSLLNFNLDLL